MPSHPDYYQQLHEDRLQKLEEDVSEVRVDVGVLKTQVHDGFEMLADKLDAISNLTTRVAVIETKQHSAGKAYKFLAGLVTVAFAAILAFVGLK